MTADRSLEQATLRRCLERVDREWTIRDYRQTSEGYLPVYRLHVDTPAGSRKLVLKATPPDGGRGIAVEGRLLALIADRTDAPVPGVVGAVDDADDLPTPFVLQEYVPGDTIRRIDLGTLDQEAMARIARQTGRHLAAVHEIDVADGFGFLAPLGPDPAGDPPPSSAETVAVVDPEPDWQARFDDWVEAALSAHAESRFGDLTADIRKALDRERAALSGPFEPAIAHIDGAVENLRLDPATGDVVGLLDWAFTVVAPPSYDLVHIERSLAGGHWGLLPEVPDIGPTVREHLAAGYGERGRADVVERYEAHHDAYDLLVLARQMTMLEDWWELRDMPPDRLEAAVWGHRNAIRTLL